MRWSGIIVIQSSCLAWLSFWGHSAWRFHPRLQARLLTVWTGANWWSGAILFVRLSWWDYCWLSPFNCSGRHMFWWLFKWFFRPFLNWQRPRLSRMWRPPKNWWLPISCRRPTIAKGMITSCIGIFRLLKISPTEKTYSSHAFEKQRKPIKKKEY